MSMKPFGMVTDIVGKYPNKEYRKQHKKTHCFDYLHDIQMLTSGKNSFEKNFKHAGRSLKKVHRSQQLDVPGLSRDINPQGFNQMPVNAINTNAGNCSAGNFNNVALPIGI